jgi:hypothetical protein
VILAIALSVAIPSLFIVPGLFPVTDAEVARFARAHGVTTSPDVRRFLRYYLTTGNRLRRLAFVAVVAVPPLTALAVGSDGRGVAFYWTPVVVGLMVATLLTELSLGRPATRSTRRVASLRRRDLGAYLSRPLLVGPSVAGATAAVAWLSTLRIDADRSPVLSPPTFAEVATGVAVAVAVPLVVVAACRWIVRRPQPLVDAGLAAADDAVRVASVRRLAAMGCVVALLNLAGALARYTQSGPGHSDALPWLAITVVLIMAWIAWLARAWGPASTDVAP